MNDIIQKMRNELRLILKNSVADYPTKPREKWLFDWSSQMILVVNQIFWCQEVEQVRRRAPLNPPWACPRHAWAHTLRCVEWNSLGGRGREL